MYEGVVLSHKDDRSGNALGHVCHVHISHQIKNAKKTCVHQYLNIKYGDANNPNFCSHVSHLLSLIFSLNCFLLFTI